MYVITAKTAAYMLLQYLVQYSLNVCHGSLRLTYTLIMRGLCSNIIPCRPGVTLLPTSIALFMHGPVLHVMYITMDLHVHDFWSSEVRLICSPNAYMPHIVPVLKDTI